MTSQEPGSVPVSAASRNTRRAVVVVVASFVIGCLESWAQGLLPEVLKPLSNSASGWTLVTALLVYWSRSRSWRAAVLAAASFALLVVGYSVMSSWRGIPYSPVLWGGIGVIVGPFLGIATSWLRRTGLRAAAGTAVLAGIGIGESVYGLTTIADTTGFGYWIGVGIIGLALAVWMLARRVRGGIPIAVLIGGTAVVAGAFLVTFRLL